MFPYHPPMATTANATDIKGLIRAELGAITETRHALHRIPEVMHEERKTSDYIAGELASLGIVPKRDVGGRTPGTGTGMIAHLPAMAAGEPIQTDRPAVGIRADMDALPIVENTGAPYTSENHGVMHACGHDGHMAVALGAARVLSKLPDRPNPVTVIFQPAEEGGFGGEYMVRDGALNGEAGGGLGPRVGRVYGLHGWPELDLGVVGTRPGPLMAATDEFTLTVEGVGGHGAYPHLTRDPILASAAIIQAVQSIVARRVKPLNPAVVTVASIHSGAANNVIPGSARLNGTLRAIDDATRAVLKEEFFRIVEQTATAYGCTARIGWEPGYPVVLNDPDEATRVLAVADGVVGKCRSVLVPEPTMGGEDFSYYCDQIPACFFWVGLRPSGSEKCPLLHQAEFNFNDGALEVGVEMMVKLALA